MTKNLTKIFMSAALFAGIATADTDLFAKLSNGAMSDKDAGIVELSREQKAKVVGGYTVSRTMLFTGFDGDFTHPKKYQTGLFINLNQDEIKNHFNGVLFPNNETLVMITRYHYNTRGYTNDFYIYSKISGKTRTLPWNNLLTTILYKEKDMAEKRNYSMRFIKY